MKWNLQIGPYYWARIPMDHSQEIFTVFTVFTRILDAHLNKKKSSIQIPDCFMLNRPSNMMFKAGQLRGSFPYDFPHPVRFFFNPGLIIDTPWRCQLWHFFTSLFDFQLDLLKSNRKTIVDFRGFSTLLIKTPKAN